LALLIAAASVATGPFDVALLGAAVLGGGVALVASVLLRRQGRTGDASNASQRAQADAMLARSEARLRGILDSAMDAIVTVDEDQRIVIFNRAAEEVFGWSQAEALGEPLAHFIPERFRGAHAGHIRHFGETGTSSRRMGGMRVVSGLHRSGREFPIEAAISQTCEDGHRFYTVILRDVTERVDAERELHRSKRELQELAFAAQSAREQEKSRMARELHDELGQDLTALRMDVAWLKERIPLGEAALADKVRAMDAVLEATVAATRRISADLRPLVLDDLGLFPAIEWLVSDFAQRTGACCDLGIEEPEMQLREPVASAVFRIVQESLTNAARHANASRVEIRIERRSNGIWVCVRDDGVGFDGSRPHRPDAYGLMGLRERALLLGGHAAVSSSRGKGTCIEVQIPVIDPAP